MIYVILNENGNALEKFSKVLSRKNEETVHSSYKPIFKFRTSVIVPEICKQFQFELSLLIFEYVLSIFTCSAMYLQWYYGFAIVIPKQSDFTTPRKILGWKKCIVSRRRFETLQHCFFMTFKVRSDKKIVYFSL